MGILDKAFSKRAIKGAIQNATQISGYTKGAQSLMSGLLGAQADEPATQNQVVKPGPLPSQNPDFMNGLLGGIGNVLGNIGDWAQKNPALFTGITTMAIGSGNGLTGLESAGLGGVNYRQTQDELQRQLEQQQKILASMQGQNIQVTDTTKQLENEINLLGLKRPQDRQAYIQKRLAGETPSYNAGVFGIGQGVY